MRPKLLPCLPVSQKRSKILWPLLLLFTFRVYAQNLEELHWEEGPKGKLTQDLNQDEMEKMSAFIRQKVDPADKDKLKILRKSFPKPPEVFEVTLPKGVYYEHQKEVNKVTMDMEDQLGEMNWELKNKSDKITVRLFYRDSAEKLLQALRKDLPQLNLREHLAINHLQEEAPPPVYRLEVPEEFYQKYHLDRPEHWYGGKKYYERGNHIFDTLTHSTTFDNLIKILKTMEIKPRSKMKEDGVDSMGHCNPDVVYTMLMKSDYINPMEGADLQSSVVMALPMSLLDREDWFISDSWNYGHFSDGERSAWNSNKRGVHKIMVDISKQVEELMMNTKLAVANLKTDVTANWLFKKLQNEVDFANPISLERPGPAALDAKDPGRPLRIYFVSEELREKFIKEMEANSLSERWDLSSKGMGQSKVPFLDLNRKDKK